MLGTGLKKQVAVAILLLLLLEERSTCYRECQTCLLQEATGRAWLHGLGQAGRVTGARTQGLLRGEALLRQLRAGAPGRKSPARALSCGLCRGGGHGWEVSWPGQAARPQEGGPLLGPWPRWKHLLSVYYAPDTEEEQLIRSRQPWEQGLKALGRKQLLITWGFPGAPRFQLGGIGSRGIFGAFLSPPTPPQEHLGAWAATGMNSLPQRGACKSRGVPPTFSSWAFGAGRSAG